MHRLALSSMVLALLFALGCGGLLPTRRPTPSAQVLAAFHAPTQVLFFAPPDSPEAKAFGPYLDGLRKAKGVTVELVDPAIDPVRARDLGARHAGTLVLARGKRSVALPVGSDTASICGVLPVIDTAILEMLGQIDAPVCDVAVFPPDLTDVGMAVEDLKHPVHLVDAQAFPGTHACVFVVRGPLSDVEAAAVRAHLAGGGSALLLAGIRGAVGLDALGVGSSTALLVDDKAHVRIRGDLSDRRFLATDALKEHPATNTLLPSHVAVAFPDAVKLDPPAGATVLIRTEPSAWLDVDGDLQPGPDETRGSFPLALALETQWGGRVVVIGSPAVFSNRVVEGSRGNALLLANVLHWLWNEDGWGWFTPPTRAQRQTCEDDLG